MRAVTMPRSTRTTASARPPSSSCALTWCGSPACAIRGSPLPVLLDMRWVRSRIYRLLDRRLWPREQTDLLFLLGCLNGLMGITANRVGYPDAAEELIRAGY